MKYRAMDANDDYTFGSNSQFLQNTPAAVAQAIETRMRLATNEWFLDTSEGLDLNKILGTGTAATRDPAIKQRILGTPGVKSLISYNSSVSGRDMTVTAVVDTIYGHATVQGVF